jgi:predicted transcriptional regulator
MNAAFSFQRENRNIMAMEVAALFLEEVLGSKTKIRILYTLFKREKETYFEKELAVACGSSVSEVNRQINSLVEFGLVLHYKEGRLKIYKLNPAHFLYKPLKDLFTIIG